MQATGIILKGTKYIKKELDASKRPMEQSLLSKEQDLKKKDQGEILENEEEIKKLREKNEEITQEAKVFTAKSILEQSLKMYNNSKDNYISFPDQEAWKKYLKNLNGEEEVCSKVDIIGESERVMRDDESKNIDEKENISYVALGAFIFVFVTLLYFN